MLFFSGSLLIMHCANYKIILMFSGLPYDGKHATDCKKRNFVEKVK